MSKKYKMTERGKKFLKRLGTTLLGGMITVGGIKLAVINIEEAKKQNKIDKENAKIEIMEIPEEVNVSEERRKEIMDYFKAVDALQKSDLSLLEQEKYEHTIVNAVLDGTVVAAMKNTIDAKLIQAAKLGESKKIDKYDSSDPKVEYYMNIEEGKNVRISNVKETYFEIGGFDFLDEVPDNLDELAKQYFKYKKYEWGNKDRDDCIKYGVESADVIENVLKEYYVIDDVGMKKGKIVPRTSIVRITPEEMEKRKDAKEKEKQDKRVQSRKDAYIEYGAFLPRDEEIER